MKRIVNNIDDDKKNANCKDTIKLYNLELDEFKKIKTAPKDRWFNSIVSFMVAGSCIMIGVIIVCLVIIFQ